MADLSLDAARLPTALVRWVSDLTHEGMFATDRSLRVIIWNRWMELHSNRPASATLGQPLFELFPDLVARGLNQYYTDALAGRVNMMSQGLHKHIVRLPPTNPDLGLDDMPQSGRIAPLSDGTEVIGTVTTLEDVSDRLGTEARLRRQVDIQHAARLTAERALRAKDEFLSTVSHEMRNPLNAVLGWTKLLIDRPDVDAALLSRALRVIDRNAMAQIRIVDDLLDVARIASGKLKLDMQSVDLLAVTLAAIDVVTPSARAKQIEIRTHLDSRTPHVLGDHQRLQQVAWNLLSNAVKFTGRGGRIDVRVMPVGKSTRLEVTDTGQGISPDFLPFVFERFRQSDGSSARRHGGLGLGLALVRELVELHGGVVRADSSGEGQGAVFWVDLPSAMSVEPRRRDPDSALGSRDVPTLTGLRVLVLEDERDSRELFAQALTAWGAEVTTVSSSQEALLLIKESLPADWPHVIMSDLGMPDTDGFEFVRQLRLLGAERGGRIPAIAVTGYASPHDRDRALAAGFTAHVPKPIDPVVMLSTVARAARLAQP